MAGRPTTDPAARFWPKVAKGPGCWDWRACTVGGGYGRFFDGRRDMRAHVFSWILHGGRPPDWNKREMVLHSCDNRACVNPAHLRIGSHAENMRDMTSRGRQTMGEAVNTAKLSAADVLAIREAFALGGVSQSHLAGCYGMTSTMISFIVRGKHWRHVGGPITVVGRGKSLDGRRPRRNSRCVTATTGS